MSATPIKVSDLTTSTIADMIANKDTIQLYLAFPNTASKKATLSSVLSLIATEDKINYNPNLFKAITDRAAPVIPFRSGETYVEYVPAPIIFPDGITTYALTKGNNTNHLALSERTTLGGAFSQWGTGIAQGDFSDWDNGTIWDGLLAYEVVSGGDDVVHCYYKGISGTTGDIQIGYATKNADDLPATFDKYGSNPVLSKADVETAVGYTTSDIAPNDIVKVDGTLYLFFSVGNASGEYEIWYATSADYTTWAIQAKAITPTDGFDMASYCSIVKLDDDKYYAYYDQRVSTVLSGSIRCAYTDSLDEPFKDLPDSFLEVKDYDVPDTTFVGRIYAGKWLKRWDDWLTPATVQDKWEFYYSASDKGSPRSDRAFLAQIPPYNYRVESDPWAIRNDGNTLGVAMAIGTKDNFSIEFLVNNLRKWFINTQGRFIQDGLTDDGYDIQATTWISATESFVNNNAQLNVRLGNVYTGNPTNIGAKRLAAIGNAALRYVTGNDNTALGYMAGNATTTGKDNTYLGSQAGRDNATGNYNTIVGMYAYLSGGSYNVTLGYQTGFLASGDFNTLLGYQAGDAVTSGGSNVIIGGQAGHGITTGSGNVIIGISTGYSSGNTSNRLMIDNSTTTTPLIDGDFSTDQLTINGGLTITDCPEHADNTAATTAGLGNGRVYRTGDILKIVH